MKMQAMILKAIAWGQTRKVTDADAAADDRFGAAVAVRGDAALPGDSTVQFKDSSTGGSELYQRSKPRIAKNEIIDE